MADRIKLEIKITLLSDAVFSSGESVPGGEDISVYTDKEGYPFFKATSFKGVLREEAENYARWTKQQDENIINALFGEEGRENFNEERRITFADFTIENNVEKNISAEDCYVMRAFTQIEDGVAKDKSLRVAKCIKRGLVFRGEITCAVEDEEFVTNSIMAVKWIGALRNKGFGQIQINTGIKTKEIPPSEENKLSGSVIKYTITALQPLIITNLSAGTGNYDKTRTYIPGSVLRGFVAGKLTKDNDIGKILSDKVRFLNAYPLIDGKNSIPSPSGYYESKDGNTKQCILVDDIKGGVKRAKLGSHCIIEENTFTYINVKTNSSLRINLKDKKGGDNNLFETSSIDKDQTFTGYIILNDPDDTSLCEKIAGAVDDEILIGADRYEGFGKCSIKLEASDMPYEDIRQKEAKAEVYMLAVSPLTMLDETGEPCGLNLKALASKLGVRKVNIDRCSTSLSEYGSFNRTWGCRSPGVKMYTPGSVFKLKFEKNDIPPVGKLREIERTGLGIRRAEGYGQVLFINLPTSGWDKEKKDDGAEKQRDEASDKRRKKIKIINLAKDLLKCNLSTSQLAEIEKALESGGKKEYNEMVKNKTDYRKKDYEKVDEIINNNDNSRESLIEAIRYSRRLGKAGKIND